MLIHNDSDNEDDPTAGFLANEEELDPSTENIDITLTSGVRIRSSKVQKVIRFINFHKDNKPENYFRESILLYVPWRKEPKDILGTYETYGIHFEAKQHIIEIKLKEYESNHTISQELLEQVGLDNIDTDNELATVAPNTEQREADDALQGPTDSTDYAFYQPTSQEHARYDMSADIGVATSTAQRAEMLAHRIPDEDFLNSLSQLNLRQREFFTHVMQKITSGTEPLHVFLTGGAGVGKSMVITTLYQALHRHLCATEGEDAEDMRLLLCL